MVGCCRPPSEATPVEVWKVVRQVEGSNYPMGIAVIGRLYRWLAFP